MSVIIGAYEAMPYLVECLRWVEARSIEPGRHAVNTRDHGSTDGTG
ncbi:glycosyltransferase family 2 protein, partial [Streptomyces sp. NPDC059374]